MSLNFWQIASILTSLILLLTLNFQTVFSQAQNSGNSFWSALGKTFVIFALEGFFISLVYNVVHVAPPFIRATAYLKFDNAETLGILLNLTMLIILNVLIVSRSTRERARGFWISITRYPLADFGLLSVIYGSVHGAAWLFPALAGFLPITIAVLSVIVSCVILGNLAHFNGQNTDGDPRPLALLGLVLFVIVYLISSVLVVAYPAWLHLAYFSDTWWIALAIASPGLLIIVSLIVAIFAD